MHPDISSGGAPQVEVHLAGSEAEPVARTAGRSGATPGGGPATPEGGPGGTATEPGGAGTAPGGTSGGGGGEPGGIAVGAGASGIAPGGGGSPVIAGKPAGGTTPPTGCGTHTPPCGWMPPSGMRPGATRSRNPARGAVLHPTNPSNSNPAAIRRMTGPASVRARTARRRAYSKRARRQDQNSEHRRAVVRNRKSAVKLQTTNTRNTTRKSSRFFVCSVVQFLVRVRLLHAVNLHQG